MTEEVVETINYMWPTAEMFTDTKLNQERSRLLSGKKFCDLVISVEGTEIAVHQVILACSSTVFEISDFDAETIQEMIQFIYSRKPPDFENLQLDSSLELLRAADKYMIEDLKSLLLTHFLRNMNVKNVCKIFLLADARGISFMKEQCLQYILSASFDTSAFDQDKVLDDRPDLMRTIIIELLQHSATASTKNNPSVDKNHYLNTLLRNGFDSQRRRKYPL